MTDGEKEYYDCLTRNYEKLKDICNEVCKRNKETFSEDKINDTVIHIHKIIENKGRLDDMSDNGIMRYFVRSYVNNLRMEKRYAYVKKRDDNITTEAFNQRYDETHSPLKEKLRKDLFEDFSILFIMKQVELNFDAEHFYLYKLKTLLNKTYKEIYDTTHIKKSREKILEVSRWVKANLSREIIKREFEEIYGALLND